MNLYLDVGAHVGKTVRERIASHPADQVIAFEPNPAAYTHSNWDTLRQLGDVTLITKAAWTKEGHIQLRRNPARRYEHAGDSQGATLMEGKTTGDLAGPGIDVECLDFSKWVWQHCGRPDRVVCKMDIEGAEYAVLQRMVIDGTLKLFDELHIEFHGHKIGLNRPEQCNGEIVRQCRLAEVLLVIKWH